MRKWAQFDTAIQYAKGLEAIGQLKDYPVTWFIAALFKCDEETVKKALGEYYAQHDPFQIDLIPKD